MIASINDLNTSKLFLTSPELTISSILFNFLIKCFIELNNIVSISINDILPLIILNGDISTNDVIASINDRKTSIDLSIFLNSSLRINSFKLLINVFIDPSLPFLFIIKFDNFLIFSSDFFISIFSRLFIILDKSPMILNAFFKFVDIFPSIFNLFKLYIIFCRPLFFFIASITLLTFANLSCIFDVSISE